MSQEAPKSLFPVPPLWLGDVNHMLGDIKAGRVASYAASQTMHDLCRHLIYNEKLPDLGQLQYYLLAQDSPVLLYAQRFNPSAYPQSACVDYRTRQAREYRLTVQPAEKVLSTLGQLSISAEGHDLMLSRMTGILIPKKAEPAGR